MAGTRCTCWSSVTAERGLCGGFNTNVIRATRAKARELLEAGKTVKLLCVGRKGYDGLKPRFRET